jgi:Leucine-rich repeat (LRR) protein
MKKILNVCFVSVVLININFACFAMEPKDFFDFSEPNYYGAFFARSRSTSITNEELLMAVSADGKLCEKAVYGLDISGCSEITDLFILQRLTNLERLSLSGCSGIKNLYPLSKLTKLKKLDLSECFGITNMTVWSVLYDLSELFWLNLSGCSQITRLPNLFRLRWLNLSGCTALKDISEWSMFNNLVVLNLSGASSLEKLPRGFEMRALKELYLKDCKELKVLPDLSGCNLLSVLDLRGTGVVAGIDEDVVEAAANEENRNTEAVKLLLAAIRERDELAEHARDRDGAPPSAGAVGDFDDGEPTAKKQRRE